MKGDVQLFSRLFIVARERQLDLDIFFKYENHKYPPSLSVNGLLRQGTKADLAEKLESLGGAHDIPEIFDCVIYDGAALVQKIRPKNSKTFQEYFDLDLKVYVMRDVQKTKCKRLDFVWDLYFPNSLKRQEREGRGVGSRRQVSPNNSLPSDWFNFLRNGNNKTEFFQFLANNLLSNMPEVNVVTNVNQVIYASNDNNFSSIVGKEFYIEEADARLVWHARDMAEHGATCVLVRSSDTDVLVLFVSYFGILKEGGLKELWMLTGTGIKSRYVPVHAIAEALGREKSEALPGFHAYTGSDNTSYFASKGKKTCFNTWISHPEVTPAFAMLSSPLSAMSEENMKLLEKYTCFLYDPHTSYTCLHEVRRDLFATKNKLVQFIPPTFASLEQHALRAMYQAGHLWGNVMTSDPKQPPSPSLWGWQFSNECWVPLWFKKK